MTIVAIHCSSHLTPTEQSTHLATSTDNLSTFRGQRKTDRERERRPDFSELHYMPFNNQLFKSAAVKLYLLHICWKKDSKNLRVQNALQRYPDKSITIYNAWNSSQTDYLFHKQAATFYFVKFESQC